MHSIAAVTTERSFDSSVSLLFDDDNDGNTSVAIAVTTTTTILLTTVPVNVIISWMTTMTLTMQTTRLWQRLSAAFASTFTTDAAADNASGDGGCNCDNCRDDDDDNLSNNDGYKGQELRRLRRFWIGHQEALQIER
jgi:hypothetical protein